MDEITSATLVQMKPAIPFDCEPRDENGVLSIGWEVTDDYGHVIHRAAWINGQEWTDPELADVSPIPALREKVKHVRVVAIAKVKGLLAADVPYEEEATPAEGFIPVPADVLAAWEALDLVCSKAGPVTNVDNVLRVLEGSGNLQGRIWFDEFSGMVMTNIGLRKDQEEREWTDGDTRMLWVELQRRLSLHRLGKEAVFEAVMTYATMNRRHPVKEWLAQTPWDKVPRIDTFLTEYMGSEDTPLHRAMSANFFVGMIARVYAPGCKVDNMLVLEGEQGAKKSSALKALCGKWFTECNEPISQGNNKDFYAVLQGKMLVEIAELDSFSRADIRRIKAIITTASDRYRPAYGRITESFPRTSVFVGTTNEDEYLEDATGGRRFWPVRVGAVDLEGIERDRAQLFAEALHRYRVKPQWWEVPKEEATQAQAERRKRDAWEPAIAQWLNEPSQALVKEYTSVQIAESALKISTASLDQRILLRIAFCMKCLGYSNKLRRNGSGRVVRMWCR